MACRIGLRAPDFSRLRSAILLIVVSAFLVACQTLKPVKTDVVKQAIAPTDADARWWYLRFRFTRDSDGEVKSYLDPLIADQIMAPLLADSDDALPLWRFHRRWPEDTVGHQFSFVFFASETVAADLNERVGNAPLLGRLRTDGHLREYRLDRVEGRRARDRAATSDRSWAPEIQRAWPVFIMGASRMWLALVHAQAGKVAEQPLYDRYRAAEQALDDLWFREGNHAMFHHLSALFGYKPLRVIRRDVMTF